MDFWNLLLQVEGWDIEKDYGLLILILGIVALILILVYIALESRNEEE
ncbi:MAG: hypothetical protein ACTSU5_18035 [Promethearchaeota archaeon]